MADIKPSKKILATAAWAEFGETSTGKPRIRIGFDLDEAAPNGKLQDHVDLYRPTPGKRNIAEEALKVLGVDLNTSDVDSDGLTKLDGGKRASLTFLEEPDQDGTPRWRAKWINAIPAKSGNVKLSLFMTGGGNQANPSSGGVVDTTTDEEVPF
jgi:hypothetical protein